jgi:Holliday junction DNA helicase RuvB
MPRTRLYGNWPGTPRVANRLLRRTRDFAAVEGDGRVTLSITQSALALAQIDERGLDDQDRAFLRTMIEVYAGGPVGIEAVAATMGEERDTLEDVIEPYLLQNAFVTRTRQGRRATKLAYDHLGMKYQPPKEGDSLFESE